MDLHDRLLELPLEFTFTIARASTDVARTVLVELTTVYEGTSYTGLGEAVPAAFYGETPDSVRAFYEQVRAKKLLAGLDPFNIQELEARLDQIPEHRAAKAAIDAAVYDIQGKILAMPLYRLWGLDPSRAPKTSYTIGIAEPDLVRHKTQVAVGRGYDILKVKLGGPQDWETLCLVRDVLQEEAPQTTLRVDANAAWTLDHALDMLPRLANLGVEFIEEPLRLESLEADYQTLKDQSPLPLMADESCHILTDIPRCSRFFHAINLKPTKTGGLTEARRMIHAARAHGLKIMLGCFTETSVANTAFAQLSPLVDYADLDGSLLLAQDPFDGMTFEGSQIRLPSRPGIGVVAKTPG